MSEDSEALIREIEEEVRREKLTKLWNQYGALFLGGLAALVVVVGGWQWYTAYQLDRTQTAGAQFQESVQFLEGKSKPEGLSGLEQIAKEGTPAYATLAKLRLAAERRELRRWDPQSTAESTQREAVERHELRRWDPQSTTDLTATVPASTGNASVDRTALSRSAVPDGKAAADAAWSAWNGGEERGWGASRYDSEVSAEFVSNMRSSNIAKMIKRMTNFANLLSLEQCKRMQIL